MYIGAESLAIAKRTRFRTLLDAAGFQGWQDLDGGERFCCHDSATPAVSNLVVTGQRSDQRRLPLLGE